MVYLVRAGQILRTRRGVAALLARQLLRIPHLLLDAVDSMVRNF
nr:MAG TPA: hypothetical protein [Caudoviricetes sp.]